jgi:hypothetical protein
MSLNTNALPSGTQHPDNFSHIPALISTNNGTWFSLKQYDLIFTTINHDSTLSRTLHNNTFHYEKTEKKRFPNTNTFLPLVSAMLVHCKPADLAIVLQLKMQPMQ